MRKSISIAVVAFAAGVAFSSWMLPNITASARGKFTVQSAQTIDTLQLTKKAGPMPVEQFDAH